jgi:hypothetical protein
MRMSGSFRTREAVINSTVSRCSSLRLAARSSPTPTIASGIPFKTPETTTNPPISNTEASKSWVFLGRFLCSHSNGRPYALVYAFQEGSLDLLVVWLARQARTGQKCANTSGHDALGRSVNDPLHWLPVRYCKAQNQMVQSMVPIKPRAIQKIE